MDSISPLAKILAEANGIDWRSLQGSGQGGSIVEQDILNYLSRVMSGDEEPPATPVDELPQGWTGEMPPMPVNPSGLEALKAAGVESDITDFVDQQAQAAMPQVTAPPEVAAPEPLIIRPVTPETVGGAAMAESVVAPAVTDSGDLDADSDFELDDLNEDDLELDDAPDWSQAAQPAYDPVQGDPEGEFVLADSRPAGSTDSASGDVPASAGTGGLTDSSGLGAHPGATPLQSPLDERQAAAAVQPMPEVPETEVSEPGATGAGQEIPLLRAVPAAVPPVQAEQAGAAATTSFGLGGFLSRLYGNKNAASSEAVTSEPVTNAPLPSEPVPSSPVDVEPVQAEPVYAEPVAAEFTSEPTAGTAHTEPFATPAAEVQEAGAPGAADQVPEPVLGEPFVPQAPPIPDTPVAAPLVADQWRDQEPADIAHALPPQPIALPEAHEAEQTPEPLGVEPMAAVNTGAGQDEVAARLSGTDAGGAGTTLRLNVDLSALDSARAQLSEALYRDVPLSLLVARAAARSAGTLGLNGPVALGTHAGQALAADPSGDFRASLDDLKRHADTQPALLVLDAAELGLDELHRGDCSLSLGRAAAGQAALSLRGDVDPVRGAQFLHEVAGLLGTPVRLLF